MKASHYLIIVFIFQIINTGCNRPEEGIDSAFIEYVDLFIKEASDRGQSFEYSDVRSIRFDEIEDSSVNGFCSYVTNNISIDKENWERASENSRRATIFHELGHCVLNRRHINPVFPHGACKSIMAGGEDLSCVSTLRLGSIWYTYYNDELFDTDTPTPDWYVTEINKPVIETLVDTIATSTTIDIDISQMDLNQNFEIIASFNNWQQNDKVILNLGEQSFLVNDEFFILTSIFLDRDPVVNETTKLRFVQYDGLDYFFIDDNMFHMDNLDLDFNSLSMTAERIDDPGIDIEMEFQLNLLGN